MYLFSYICIYKKGEGTKIYKKNHLCIITKFFSRFNWTPGPWSACSKTCSLGVLTRQVTCTKQPGNEEVEDALCSGEKPSETKSCFLKVCQPTWSTGNWSEVGNHHQVKEKLQYIHDI